MKSKLGLLISLLMLSPSAYCEWDQQCLNDCISTHHACNYCDYMCRTEPKTPGFEVPENNYKCPLQGY